MFFKFAETSLIIIEKNKSFPNSRNFVKTIFIQKKIQLQLSKVGVFWVQRRKKGKRKRKRKKRKKKKEKEKKEKKRKAVAV